MRSEWVSPRRAVRLLTSIAAVPSGIASAGSARAETTDGVQVLSSPPVFSRLIGGSGGSFGGAHAGGGRGGPLLGVEGAWATTLPAQGDPSQGGWAFGARAGWAFANGLAAHVRYDDLGVEPAHLSSPLQLATAGLRYSVPLIIPLPFAEVDAGPAFVGSEVRFGAGAGLGASIPLGTYVLLDLMGRDWLVPVAGTLRQTLTVGMGLVVTFASPAR
jgi:hypothetical protein